MKKTMFMCFVLATFLISKDANIVAVSIPPQQFIVEKIASDTVNILVMVEPNANHEVYEPKSAQMIALSKSKLYFAIGLPFENAWLERFQKSSPNMLIINTDKNIKKIPISKHAHNNQDNSAFLDPHIWLDPTLVKQQAQTITKELVKTFPQNENLYLKNLKNFENELDTLDKAIKNKFENLQNSNFLVFHPSWGYFAKRYNLNQIAIEVDGKEPKTSELIKTISEVKVKNIKVLITEPQVSQKSAQTIAKEIGAKICLVDPLRKNIIDNLNDITNIIIGVEK